MPSSSNPSSDASSGDRPVTVTLGSVLFEDMTEQEIKEAKRRYLKEWRRKNPKRVAAINKRYWEKLNRIRQNTAHLVSKEIIDFCLDNDVKVISIAKVEDDVPTFEHKVGKYSPITLRRIIVNYLSYKSFKDGILVTTVRQNYTASKCNKCRAKVKRISNEYVCEN